MKSINFIMFFSMVTAVSFGHTSALAAEKEEACQIYANDALRERGPTVRLRSGLRALNAAYDLRLSPNNLLELEAHFAGKFATGELDQDNLEKAIYFGCTTDLTVADKQLMLQMVLKLLNP